MKEQQKRKIQQFHPEIEDGTDLRRWPPLCHSMLTIFYGVLFELIQESWSKTNSDQSPPPIQTAHTLFTDSFHSEQQKDF